MQVRLQKRDVALIGKALDALGLALVEHGHCWTDRERQLYERARSAVVAFSMSRMATCEVDGHEKIPQ